MKEAIEEPKTTSLSLRRLRIKFYDPISTLYDRLNGKESRFTSSQNYLDRAMYSKSINLTDLFLILIFVFN